MNDIANVVTGTTYGSILRQWHLFPIICQIQCIMLFSVCLFFTFKALYDLGPEYLLNDLPCMSLLNPEIIMMGVFSVWCHQ